MSFTVFLSDDALEDFEDVIDYYGLISETVRTKFIKGFDKTIIILSENPYYQIRYDNIRLKQVEGFSYFITFYCVCRNPDSNNIWSKTRKTES